MKKPEAINLVGRMLNWHLKHVGVLDEEPEPITESLDEMLEANHILEKINRNPLRANSRRSFYTTLDDRAIASLYVLMNYEGHPADKCQSIAQYQDKSLFIVEHAKKREPSELDWV